MVHRALYNNVRWTLPFCATRTRLVCPCTRHSRFVFKLTIGSTFSNPPQYFDLLYFATVVSLVDIERSSLSVKPTSINSAAIMITFIHRSQTRIDSCKNPMYKTMNDCGKKESRKNAVSSGTLSSSTPF